MHSSDETGDEPGRTAPAGQATVEPEPGKHPAPAHAFRERIRRASVAAAQATATAEPLPLEPVPISISSMPPEAAPTTHSSLPPEHSGVRDRPGQPNRPDETGLPAEAKSPLITSTPLTLGANPRRMTPRAWPFAAGTRSEGRRTRDTERDLQAATEDGEPEHKTPSSPGAYSVTPPSALSTTTAEGASWSPSSTKPQRASLLRSHEGSGESGRYSVRDNSVDYVEPQRVPVPPPPAGGADAAASPSAPPAAAPVADRSRMRTADHRVGAAGSPQEPVGRAPASPPGGLKSFVAEEDETTSRARRYTPKQRPAQRRGRAYDRGSPGTRAQERAVQERAVQERAELARTLPDIRTTLPGRPGALQASAPVSPESPTQPKGRPLSRPPDQPRQPRQPPRSLTPLTQPMPKLRPAQRMSPSPQPPRASSPAGAEGQEASIVVDPALLSPPPAAPAEPSVLSARATIRGGSFTSAPPGPPLPAGRSESGPEPSQVRRSGTPLARYEPLPSDPEAFERLMRERAAARGGPGARLNWNQQETLLIPRESLRPAPSGPLANRGLLWGVAAAVVFIAVTATVVLVRSTPAATKALRAVPLSTSTNTNTSSLALTQAESTVIESLPPGAELLQTGAVLGNTPLEVRRPKSGAITYTLRLSGYQPESVTVSPASKPTLRVVLRPAAR